MFLSWFDLLTTTLSNVEWVEGPVRTSPGFHFDKLSVASPVEPPLKACGNDGLWEGANSMEHAGGNSTRLD
jgi:hypothetical protein